MWNQKPSDDSNTDELLLAFGVFVTVYIVILWMCLMA